MTVDHMPLVSIIIPLYNAEKYIAQSIDTALAQTWPNKEILIIDDGSTDNSLAIASAYNSNQVKIFTQPNKGASAARNKGIAEANGAYIQFLDADDLLSPEKIAVQINRLIQQPSALATCHDIHFFDNDDIQNLNPVADPLGFYHDSNNPFEFLMKLYGAENNIGGMIPLHSWLIPAPIITKAGLWNEKLTLNDDGDFFCRIVLASSAIITVHNVYSYYRKSKGEQSLSGQKNLTAFSSHLLSIQLIKQNLNKYKTDSRTNNVIARMLTELLFQTYPAFTQLSVQIEQEIKQLGGSTYQPAIGGRMIQLIKNIFGWKTARKLQYYKQKLVPDK